MQFVLKLNAPKYQKIVQNLIALIHDIISFNLPVKIEENVISYNCLGIIDDYSFLNGICSTIAPNELGESKSYSWSFTAIPSSVQ